MDGRLKDSEVARRLGKNLGRARRQAGFSQQGLGDLCSLHRTEIGHLEKGRRLPRADTLIKISSALEVRADHLLEGIEWIVADPPGSGRFAFQDPPSRGRS